MKPLNQTERTTRLWKFILFYALALALPLAASYFLFSNDSIAAENQRLKQELERTRADQKKIIVYLDTLTNHLQRINKIDQLLQDQNNSVSIGQLNTQNEDNINSIAVVLTRLQGDTTNMDKHVKPIATNALRDFNLFRNNRNTINLLRGSLKDQGVDVSASEKLQAKLSESQNQVIMLQAALANKPSGGGGDPPLKPQNPKPPVDPSRSSGESQKEIALLTDQVAFANADCLRLRGTALNSKDQRKEMLEQARKGFVAINQAPSSDNMRQSVEKMIDVIDKELGRKRGLFGYH